MSYSVVLDGAAVTHTPGTLTFGSEFGSRSTASVKVKDKTNSIDYMALMGQEVQITDDSDSSIIFAGVLSDPTWNIILGTQTAVEWTLKFSDFSILADRVRVFEYFENATTPMTSDIVRYIITNYLAQFGVTAGTIEDGTIVSEVAYNGQTAGSALKELAKRDGYVWRIDKNKQLHYQSQTSVAAPWDVTEATKDYKSMSGSGSISDYVNKVYQKGPANGISDMRTESYVGDGVRRQFKLLYECYSNVSIKVNGVTKTVGIKGVSSGYDFYWKQGDDIIEQDAAGTPLTGSDTIAITYRGQVSMFVEIEDAEGIAARALAEGTSGIYEGMFEDASALYLDLNVQAAETNLRQRPYDKVDLTYITARAGLQAGMMQNIEVSLRSISKPFLITSVQAMEIGSFDRRLWYTVKCVSGERADDWIEWYQSIADKTDYSIRKSEIVSKCAKINATCVLSSVISVISRPQWIWGTDSTDSSLFDGGDAHW